jgi:hypothetical protein
MGNPVRLGLVLGAALLAGCGGHGRSRTAAVSGRVTLDGEPLAGARVSFYPIHDPRSGSQSGPEAHGETDSEGRYALTTVFGARGATVGPNRVMISTRKTRPDPNDPDAAHRVVAPERVPKRYFTDQAALRLDVPAEGTRTADFSLTSR